ncbi:MAG: hypothetical protein M3373_04310 [Gemmatimonadota bacterium]|nr:hypothetical protein [Gemmatimonadota bacterium]
MRGIVALYLAALALGATLTASAAVAQRAAHIAVDLPPAGRRASEAPTIRSVGVLSDSRTRDLLNHGFPARLHYRLELWSSGGWFNDVLRDIEWDVIVRLTPLDRRYVVARIIGDRVTQLGSFDQFRDVETLLSAPFQPPMSPREDDTRMYYSAALDVEMLSVNDLDEVERWLRGELRPAVRGRRNPGTAITRGLRSLVVGLLGSENRHYEARTRTFVPE